MFVGVVILHQTGGFQERRIVCKVLILNFFRTGMYQFPEQADVPFHQMRHPPARLGAQVGVQLVYQLGLPQTGTELVPQDAPEVLQFQLLESVQYGM